MAEHGITRRRFVERAGAGTAALGLAANPALARAIGGARRGKRVAVLGGGMAGLTVAHELAERGFKVDVYEPVALGGKARSIGVPGTAEGGRRRLPGEHGFRFFPGFYHHVPDSMRRIPDGGNPNGVWDNLVDTTEGRSVRSGDRPDALLLGMFYDPNELLTVDGLRRLLVEEIVKQQWVGPHEAAYLVERILVFLTSSRCPPLRPVGARRLVGLHRRREPLGRLPEGRGPGLTRSLVAAKETVASTRTIGNMAEAFIMNIMGRGNDGALDRVLDAPTNEAWINPWVKLLKGHGVRFHMGHRAVALKARGGRIEAAVVRDRHGVRRRVEADWFVSAMPVERARKLLSRKVLAADPELEGMRELKTDWMVGIQYYLRRADRHHQRPRHLRRRRVGADRANPGASSGPSATSRPTTATAEAVDCLSVDVSDWDTPGPLPASPRSAARGPRSAARSGTRSPST